MMRSLHVSCKWEGWWNSTKVVVVDNATHLLAKGSWILGAILRVTVGKGSCDSCFMEK